MKNLLCIRDLIPEDVERLFRLAARLKKGRKLSFAGRSAIVSFEGNSLRTRATFLKALADLGVTAVELPNLLKTAEEKRHLAGYLDQWCDLYLVRESNHAAIEALAAASRRPVINAMSAQEHPCEVLADAFFVWERFKKLNSVRFCLAGPQTNVLRSWQGLCELLGLSYVWAAPEGWAPAQAPAARSLEEGLRGADVVLTDGWPAGFDDPAFQVTPEKMRLAAPHALVIPCPPFNTAHEVSEDLIQSDFFAGYAQKEGLYWAQKALVATLLPAPAQPARLANV